MTVKLETDVVPLLSVLTFVTDVPVPAPVMVVPAGRFGHCADDITKSSETFSTVVSHPPAMAIDGNSSATTVVAARARCFILCTLPSGSPRPTLTATQSGCNGPRRPFRVGSSRCPARSRTGRR